MVSNTFAVTKVIFGPSICRILFFDTSSSCRAFNSPCSCCSSFPQFNPWRATTIRPVSSPAQIARHQISPFRDGLYLFDKQYGTYFLLAFIFKLFPEVDPITLGNAALVLFYGVGSILAFYAAEESGFSRRVGIMLCLVPSLVLYAPFLGTSQLSLAFLLLSYPLLVNRAGAKFYADC